MQARIRVNSLSRVVACLCTHTPAGVVATGLSGCESGEDTQDGEFCLVMPQAAYSLATVILHKQLAGRWSPENQWVTNTLRYIAVSLKELHDEELVHGDVKLKNVVRVGETVKAIDFDGSI